MTATSFADADLTPAQERMATAALALAAFALNLNTVVIGALKPFLPQELLPGANSIEWLVGGAAAGSALGALLLGPLADRIGRRTPLVVGSAGFAVLSLLHLWADSFAVLFTLRVLSGFAVGVAYASASALAANLVPYHRRGKTMGIFTAGMFLAVPIGLPLAIELAKAGHWSFIFGVQSLIALVGLAFSICAVPRDRGTGAWVAPWHILRRPPVLFALAAVALHNGSFFTTVQLATGWLDHTGIVPKNDQGLLFVGLGLVSAIGSFVLGRVSDRYGKRNFVLGTSVVLLMCFGLLDEHLDRTFLLVLGVLLALTAAARTGPLQALISGLVPAHEIGTVMGLRAFAMQIGVTLFALAAAQVEVGFGFAGVLLAASACQALVYVVIRVGVREGT
ncbi:MFS transporter [Planctomycetota bacterium]|nr:MFS transporter [Planctomycetota bacterium]